MINKAIGMLVMTVAVGAGGMFVLNKALDSAPGDAIIIIAADCETNTITYNDTLPNWISLGPEVWTAHESPPSDINGDGRESLSDVIYLINYVFRGGPAPPTFFREGPPPVVLDSTMIIYRLETAPNKMAFIKLPVSSLDPWPSGERVDVREDK